MQLLDLDPTYQDGSFVFSRPNQPVIPVVLKRFEANNNRFFRYFPHQFRVQDSRLTSHDLTCWG